MADDPKPNESLLAEAEARYEDAKTHASQWREGAKEDYRFYAGDQWSEEDTEAMKAQQRPLVSFNRVKRLIDAVTGHEANNRAEVRYIPRTIGDAKINELLTNAGQYFRDNCDAEFEESDAFRDDLICGMGWTNDRLSDAQNPEYDLIEERVDPMEMLWDPSAKKPNLADSRYLFRRKRYTEKEIKGIWPEFKGPFLSAFGDDAADLESETKDGGSRHKYQGDEPSSDVRPDVLVVEYQYKEREAYHSVHGSNGETIEIPAEKFAELKDKLDKAGIQHTSKRKTVTRRLFIIGRSIVQGPDVVYPQDFTYHCVTGFRDREKNHWFGIVRMLKDPQRWSNKWLAQIMHILNSNAKGGLMAEEGAVANRHEFESSWADPAAVTWFADGALKDARVQPKPPPLYPQGVDRLLEYANTSFTDVSGVNQELLGLADREQPGVLEWQRKQSAVTLLAPLFDSLRRFRKMQGRCWLYMMQKYVSDGRIIRITTDQGQQVAVPFGGPPEMQAQIDPQWRMPETAEYDVIVDQAATAPNQKEQTWGVMQTLLPAIKDFLTPKTMMWALKYSPLPETAQEELKQIQQEEAANPKPDPEMMKVQAQLQAKQQELQIKQQEAQLSMAVEQQKAQMQLEIEKAKMALEMEKAQMQMGIEREKASQSMMLAQQQASFDAQQQQQKFTLDAQAQEQQMRRDDQTAAAQAERDDAASDAKIKREDRSARAKAKRQPQPGAQ